MRSNPDELGSSGASVEITASFRAAIKEDCYDIARLFRIASDGVADYVWSTLTPKYPGLTPLEIGTRRYASEEGKGEGMPQRAVRWQAAFGRRVSKTE